MHLPNYVDFNKISEQHAKLRKFYSSYVILGAGSYRTTYDLGNGTVAKVPSENSLDCGENTGISANLMELAIYKKLGKLGIFAKPTLIWKFGLPVLIMEKIDITHEPSPCYDRIIKENGLSFDDGRYQCGKNSKGKTVCFDYGNEFDFLDVKDLQKVKLEYTKVYKKFAKKEKKVVSLL